MKKPLKLMVLLGLLLPALSGCGEYDYSSRISESRSDVFCAETEEFSVMLSCISREYPYAADGIPCETSNLIEVVLTDAQGEDCYSVYLTADGKEAGGDMSFRNVRGDFYYSRSVTQFPEGNVSLRIEWDDQSREITATSVKNENTLTVNEALSAAVNAEKEYVQSLTENGEFRGEFQVRLLRREKNYYYVGITDREGKTLSLLLDGESGEILAKRSSELPPKP